APPYELYFPTASSRLRGSIGASCYGLAILRASSATVSALKNQPFGSTFGGLGSHSSRVTPSASKIAQIGPPPFNFRLFASGLCLPRHALRNPYVSSSSFQNRFPN